SVSYWDTVIQPETHDELAAAFRKAYGLPGSFTARYTLSTTLGLITRVEQEVNSGNVTIDIASIASPPWINGLVSHGHIMNYTSPQYAAFATAFARGWASRITTPSTVPIHSFPPGTPTTRTSRASRGRTSRVRFRPAGSPSTIPAT